MKKILKIAFVIISIFFVIGTYFYYQMITSSDRQEKDIKNCLDTKYITEKPSFCLEKNSNIEIFKINIELIRNNKLIKDTLLNENIENRNQYLIFNIPFNKFLKTDIVIVKTKNQSYKISGFDHSSDVGHWGIFGYFGDNNCYFDYDKIKINDKKYIGIK